MHRMPFILLGLIIGSVLFEPYLPLALKQGLYALSLSIKSLIITALPFLIFALLFKAAQQLAAKATGIIVILLITVCASNALSTFLSHFIGEWVYHQFDLSLLAPTPEKELSPLWLFLLPKLIPNNWAMFGGILCGIVSAQWLPIQAAQISQKAERFVKTALKVILWLLPPFILGFIVKLQHENLLEFIFHDYAKIFCIIAASQFAYILFLYALSAGFRFLKAATFVRDMFPAALSGFTTMSSAASLPLILMGAEKNAQSKPLIQSVIPATVNIHLIGDCFAIPILAYAVLKTFGLAAPDMLTFAFFTFYFVLAKFSVAAVPGGGILVMLPVLERYLGFQDNMLTLITALYILFDPIITCANVFGNGAFARIFDRLWAKRLGIARE